MPNTEPVDTRPLGRRERNKQATRQALQEAADRLVAERGVLQTTVRDIAEAAGVTERTFFRYFRSKEDLLIKDAFAWMPALQEAVVTRPAAEPPLVAVQCALEALMAPITRLDAPSPLTLFAAGAPGERLGAASISIMRKTENDLADAIEQRLTATATTSRRRRRSVDVRFQAEVLARAALAAFRTAMLRDSELRREGATDRPPLADLIAQAFDTLTDQRAR